MTLWARLQGNLPGFWGSHRWFILVFAATVLCDAASTIYFMYHDPGSEETHPAIALAAKILGPVVGPLLGALAKTLAGLVVAIYLRRYAAYLFVAGSLLSFWAAWYNVWGKFMYEPWFMKWIPW